MTCVHGHRLVCRRRAHSLGGECLQARLLGGHGLVRMPRRQRHRVRSTVSEARVYVVHVHMQCQLAVGLGRHSLLWAGASRWRRQLCELGAQAPHFLLRSRMSSSAAAGTGLAGLGPSVLLGGLQRI